MLKDGYYGILLRYKLECSYVICKKMGVNKVTEVSHIFNMYLENISFIRNKYFYGNSRNWGIFCRRSRYKDVLGPGTYFSVTEGSIASHCI